MKKWYRNFVIVLAVIWGIAGFTLIIWSETRVPYPTEEDYKVLKDYSMQIVSGVPIKEIEKKDVEVNAIVDETYFAIEVESYNCILTSKFSVNESSIEIKDGYIHYISEVQENEIKYSEESKVKLLVETMTYAIILSGFSAGIIYGLLYEIPKSYKEKMNKIKENKNT